MGRDEFYVRVPDKLDRKITTKRGMLKLIASVYDPIGLVSPYILRGRIFMQQANERLLDWDEPLPPEIIKPFKEWKASMPGLKDIRVPRWVSKERARERGKMNRRQLWV